jgi:hypothetical protein
MEEFKNSINKSIKDLEKIILIEENEYNILVSNLKKINDEINKQIAVRDQLLNDNNDILNKNELKLNNLEKKENEINEREKKIIEREHEVEESRKVSILKNIQDQLHKKIEELEVCQKQRDFYRKNDTLLGALCNKYQINYETITLEKIEEAIKATVNTIDIKSTVIEEVKPMIISKEEEQQQEQQQEQEEECIEVEDLEYNGKIYYLDNNKNIYDRLENDEIGEIIGSVDNKGKVKLNKKR